MSVYECMPLLWLVFGPNSTLGWQVLLRETFEPVMAAFEQCCGINKCLVQAHYHFHDQIRRRTGTLFANPGSASSVVAMWHGCYVVDQAEEVERPVSQMR